MAEVVHRNLELMLPELEELERSGIFSPQEIKEIVRRRRGMEYKLQRRPVRREDFLRAITYELNLDRLRKVRKKRLGVTSARRDADYGIQDRVHSLFKRAVKRFKADVRLWLQYIDFCRKSRHHVTLGKILARAIALHPNKPGLWVMAGKFQFEDQNDPSSGRSTMQQGLRSNPSSTHLWLEYFRMELMHVDKMKKRRLMLGLEKSEDEELEKLGAEFFSYEIPSIVFQQAVKAVPNNVQFLVSFVDIYRLFDGSEQRQEEVYSCLRRDYSHLADCWEALARRHWTNIDTTTLTGTEVSSIEEVVEGCYREGLGVTVQPSSLWRHYLKWCREVTENEGTDSTQLRAIKRLLNGYQNCTKSQHMSVDMIEEQVQVLRSMGLKEEAHRALVTGTQTYPDSHTLWLLRLRNERSGGREEGGEGEERECASLIQLCSEATKAVPAENSLSLWQFWLEVLISSDTPDSEVDATFQRAIAETPQPADQTALSRQYIDWALSVGGVKSARKTYKMFLEKATVPYPIYCKCIEIEKSMEKQSMKRLRDLYDKVTNEWGADHPDLWLDYITSETGLKGGDPTRVGSLHWKAMKTLNGAHTADFVSKYSLLHLNS